MQIQKPLQFITNADSFLKEIASISPIWINNFRNKSLNNLSAGSIPTKKYDDYHYTDLNEIFNNEFHIAQSTEFKQHNILSCYLKADDINLFFVNGIFNDKLSCAENNNLEIRQLTDLINDANQVINPLISEFTDNNRSFIQDISYSLLSRGMAIKIKPNYKSKKLIHIIHVLDDQISNSIALPTIFIIAEKDSNADILESYVSINQENCNYINSTTNILANDDSNINYYKIQNLNKHSFLTSTTKAKIKTNSALKFFNLNVGSKLTRNDVNINLNNQRSKVILNGLTCISKDQHIDNCTTIHHKEENSSSRQLYKNILSDSSTAVFNGKIIVDAVAQGTSSNQLNRNLLLSDKCNAYSKPQLLISADDVKCTHGATSGQLNKDEIFYLQTRGISKSKAITMLAKAFADEILESIQNKEVSTKINNYIEYYFKELHYV